MRHENFYLMDVDINLNKLKNILYDNGCYCHEIGEGINRFICNNLGTYQLYIGYIPGIGFKGYLMNYSELISNIKPERTIKGILNVINTVEQFRDNCCYISK